jgi:hypothetical protein
LLSDLASASGALKPSVASTASDATAKNEERMLSMDRKGREHSCLRGSEWMQRREVLTSGIGEQRWMYVEPATGEKGGEKRWGEHAVERREKIVEIL